MLWVIFALLTGAAVFSVLWPLSRPATEVDARDLDVAFYRAQTVEIARDAARGLIAPDDADAAKTEAARRLVSVARQETDTTRPVSPWGARAVALGTLIVLPAAAFALYERIGAPGMPDAPLQVRLDAAPARMDMATAIAKIEQHLVKVPNDGRGWAVLAPIYVRLQRYEDAVHAYQNAIRVLGPDADRYAALGEAQMFAGGGDLVTADARRSFAQAQALDPKSPRAAFYIGLAAQQDGDKAKAAAIWRKLVGDSPPDAPWLPTVRMHLAEVDGTSVSSPRGDPRQGPMGAAVAAMPPDQQQAMIHRMVDGLATRLKGDGKDIDGWLRLVRAYRVLNEPDKAKVALADARHNFASDPEATKRLEDLAHELGLEG